MTHFKVTLENYPQESIRVRAVPGPHLVGTNIVDKCHMVEFEHLVILLDVEAEIELSSTDGDMRATLVLKDGARIPATLIEYSRAWR